VQQIILLKIDIIIMITYNIIIMLEIMTIDNRYELSNKVKVQLDLL